MTVKLANILSVILLFRVSNLNAKLACKDENGNDMDWQIIYKLPQDSESKNKLIALGEAYSYFDVGNNKVSQSKWVLSDDSVEQSTSAFGQTYSQIIKNRAKLAYIIYNDQEPNKSSSAATFGHTKGILVTDGKTGFWLVHSVPRYPFKPEDGKYDFPDNAKSNGQSALCITINFSVFPKIVTLMRYNKPKIYGRNSQPFMQKLPTEIRSFFAGNRPSYVNKAPFNISQVIQSAGGKKFLAFAKHSKWAEDLYEDAIAPNLKSPLLVETWRNGAGTKLDVDCKDKYVVYNVDEVEIKFRDKTTPQMVSFPRTVDHSKWAVTQSGFPSWACVADINRMNSQKNRGGGAVCVQDPEVWKAYFAIVDKYQGCKI